MRTSIEAFTIFFLFTIILPILIINSAAADTIAANQTIRDGDTIVSAGGNFELGFFSPGGSKNRYLGIWYKKISYETVVWVANRAIPLTDTLGVLKVESPGILVLLNSTDTIIWSSNISRSAKNPVAQLLETGNLVMRDGSEENFLCQSFDYTGDTFLPGMKLGHDPSPGDYKNWLDPNGFPQIFLKKGSVIQFRSGPWNGLGFSCVPNLKPNSIYTYEFGSNKEEEYYKYN